MDFVKMKVENSFKLDYPSDKLHFMWVTDGSDDGTPVALRAYENITVLHEPERKGKIGAINRGMKYVKTPHCHFFRCKYDAEQRFCKKNCESLQ